MIIAKLVLLASPLVIASMLFFVNPAAASPIDTASAETHVNSSSAESVHGLATLNQADQSNPIRDYLGCNCAYCVGAESPLQGKLPFSGLL
ncbi:hypothetical protein Riv7116_6724 [Rivularia sp. PCC 7116]|uniref:hypothetical protein n=1 Tax=Rivularia sp. PCC 7116 TaxID=373994 RepID=UPI00029ED9EE|nr:hypothetical protein [Rivularia sp. PCC 7116]AFY59044.1 hypothetical protein Riv7116_6724 [Rivularia sp. PCC 7116]